MATVVADSSLSFEIISLREREDLIEFEEFDSIIEPTNDDARRINDLVRNPIEMLRDPFTYVARFIGGERIVGYVFYQYQSFWHPHFESEEDAPYLYVEILAVHKDFQRTPDPLSTTGESFAKVIMRAIETIVATQRLDIVGIYGISAIDNERPRGLLDRMGYVTDVGVFPDAVTGKDSVVLRKPRELWRPPQPLSGRRP